MSDTEAAPNPEDAFNFWVDRAKSGRAGCKKCKEKIDTGTVRIAKLAYNPFGTGKMKQWHHVDCILQVFAKQRPTTAKIEKVDDMGGWDDLDEEDQEFVFDKFPETLRQSNEGRESKPSKSPSKAKKSPAKATKSPGKQKKISSKNTEDEKSSAKISHEENKNIDLDPKEEKFREKDCSFREFRKICAEISNVSSYTSKTEILKEFFSGGSGKDKFRGDLVLWVKMLLPMVSKRIYNLQSKQIVKLFSRLFETNHDAMMESLEQGDVAETISIFFEQSKKVPPSKKSLLSMDDVESFLEELSTMTKEDDQVYHFRQICPRCTTNDLKMIIRLVKHDLRINAGPKHILEAIHPDAYKAFQTSRDLEMVVKKLGLGEIGDSCTDEASTSKDSKDNISLKLMTPVLPMLAEACRSVEQAMKKCPNGMYSEIKYDGERVQVHKKGNEFKYFSRSLKPVLDHKVRHFKDFIPKAFPHGKDLVLDSEILLIDKETNKPLPFGSLGKHKKDEFSDACVCLFVFDCIFYNGESLLKKPIKERKRILRENMVEITHHIVFSEMEEIHEPEDLEGMMTKVFRLGLEGLVLKDMESTYNPGKRHWLKVKKDYLFGGSMADSADLVVIGAWYGTGNKGGMMSVFLMGCLNPKTNKWCTVTKVHGGHDDKTLERLQTELKMEKISRDVTKVPDWLICKKAMIPDFVAVDPKAQPVWEISGAEFSQAEIHTANGISIRFPRVTKIRDDKDWKTATNLEELNVLFKKSKETSDFQLKPSKRCKEKSSSPEKEKGSPPKKKVKVDSKEKEKPVKEKEDNVKDEDLVEPLPDVFMGLKMFIPKNVIEVFPEAKKYFIAFGGELLEEKHKKEATHVLGEKVEGKICVKYRWFYDSVNAEERQNENKYLIQ